jgi:DNA-binding NarL/FixJ family response regulator
MPITTQNMVEFSRHLQTPLTMSTILIADDHPLFREAMRRAVERAQPGALIAEAENVAQLQSLIEAHPEADLLLLDLTMPGAHGFSALAHIRATRPALPVIVVSAREEPMVIRRALAHGASGFVPKSADSELIQRALRTVIEGETFDPFAHGAVRLDEQERELAKRLAELTPQQFRVLTNLCEGKLNKQIAYDLDVTEATIKAHVTAILRKLGAHNRTMAVTLASRLAIDPDSARAIKVVEE